jgi:LacI family transcriptional regulator
MHRLTGYQLALSEAGLVFDPTLVRHGAFTSSSGYTAMSDLLMSLPHTELPSAMFVASDVVALGALQAARQYGLQVPQEMSFVGYDDIPLAPYLTPPLTSVRIPAADLGSHAGQTLLALLEGQPHQPRRLLLDNQLRIRDSTQAYRG